VVHGGGVVHGEVSVERTEAASRLGEYLDDAY
jgi:hypothetical protein